MEIEPGFSFSIVPILGHILLHVLSYRHSLFCDGESLIHHEVASLDVVLFHVPTYLFFMRCCGLWLLIDLTDSQKNLLTFEKKTIVSAQSLYENTNNKN